MQFKFNVIWVNLKFKLEANPNWIMQQFHFEIAVNLTSLTILFWVKFLISFISCHRKEKSCSIIKTLNYIRMKKSQQEEINTNLVLISRFWVWHFEFTSLIADFGHSDWDKLNQTITWFRSFEKAWFFGDSPWWYVISVAAKSAMLVIVIEENR